MQKLTGTLNFLNRAIVPGHAFTRGMYERLTLKDKKGELLKGHHHVSLNAEFLTDCKMWLEFLINAENQRLCCPFLDFSDKVNAKVLNFFSDASKNPNFRMGAVFDDRRWVQYQWLDNFIEECDPSIEFLELYALVAALMTWANEENQLRNSRIIIFCDNEVVVYMVNKLASSCQQCMKLLRILALEGIHHNRRLLVCHVRSENNLLSDALSRMNNSKFWRHAPPTMSEYPDKISNSIAPVTKIWNSKGEYLNYFKYEL